MSRRDRNTRQGARKHSAARSQDPRAWPIIGAYVPNADAWAVSGFGAAGIVRRQPDGKIAYCFYTFSLIEGGFTGAFGKDDAADEDVESALKDVAAHLPPIVAGPAQLASCYVHGAYAMSAAAGAQWSDEIRRYLSMLPPIPGTRQWWLQQFVGEGGLAPAGLVTYLEKHPSPPEVPRGKEMQIATFVSMAVADSRGLLLELKSRPDDFLELPDSPDAAMFHWMKERRVEPGRRVPHGVVAVASDSVEAHAATLSLASLLITKLKALAPRESDLRLVRARWAEPSELRILAPGTTILRRG